MPDDNYKGYNRSDLRLPVFSNGLQLANNSDYIGEERTLDGGYSVPGGSDHLQGDARLNARPISGGNLAWTNTPSFTTTLAGAVTGGTTTSVTVAACPSPALPAGTPVVDVPGISVGGVTSVSQPLGTLASCTSTTLTLQAAAIGGGASGDTIQFLQWRPAGLIAKDTTGIIYPTGAFSLVSNLPGCDGNNVGFATVNDGLAYGTAGYGVTVTTGGGALARPVFCDGTSWTYH
jgi:hypothetical protein